MELIISSIDDAKRELDLARRDSAAREAEAHRFRTRVRTRVAARLQHLKRARSALARGSMIKGTSVASLKNDVHAVAQHLVVAAKQVARLDADLRAARARVGTTPIRTRARDDRDARPDESHPTRPSIVGETRLDSTRLERSPPAKGKNHTSPGSEHPSPGT